MPREHACQKKVEDGVQNVAAGTCGSPESGQGKSLTCLGQTMHGYRSSKEPTELTHRISGYIRL